MMTRYEAYLDGQGLSDIDPAIAVYDITYGQPDFLMQTAERAKYAGQQITKRKLQSSTVTIHFEIHEYGIERRQDICRRIAEWANRGRMLQTNDRPGQRLRVVCTAPPVVSSALRWTQRLQMTFTAFEQPYWEDVQETRKTIEGAEGQTFVFVRGVSDHAFVSADVKNDSGQKIGRIKLTAGDTFFELTDMTFESGKTLSIGYDESVNLYIRIGGESAMQNRTAESSDDLTVPCGRQTALAIESDAAVTAVFKTRGMYL